MLIAFCAADASIPGPVTNANGAAAVLTVADAWNRRPVEGIELSLRTARCDSSGMLGAAALDRSTSPGFARC